MRLINAELLEAIDDELENAVKNNKKIAALYKRIRDGTATFQNAADFAVLIGKDLSEAFGKHIVAEQLPNGRMTFSIASEVVKPELVKGYDYTSSYFNEVQQAMFKSKKLNIKGAPPDLLEDRIDGFIEKLTSDEYEKVKWILEDAAYIENYLEAVVDTGIKNNVGMLAQGGIRPKIVREVDAGACPWCMNLAGEYEYGEEPDDVYRRHRDCHCRVSYEIPNGFRQDAWSKNWFADNPNYEWEVQERKVLDKNLKKRTEKSGRYVPKGTLTPEQAKRLEEYLLNN
jgi:hypothetical protein